MKYEELLKKNEWEVKRYEILARDNYTCQDCGCRGINNDIFFPISSISDLDILLPDCLFNGEDLHSFCNHIKWNGQLMCPNFLTARALKEHFYIYQMIAIKESIWNAKFQFEFAADSLLSKWNFQRNDRNLCFQCRGKVIYGNGYLTAFMFKEDIGQTNYAAISYSSGENREKLELKILFTNKYYYFYFAHFPSLNESMLFHFTPLNIHHNYYILGRKPWDYDNDALVTLCSRCHQKRHKQIKIPLYGQDKRLINPALPVCDRCNGTGYLPQYHYYMGGICFKCHGEGVYGFYPNS